MTVCGSCKVVRSFKFVNVCEICRAKLCSAAYVPKWLLAQTARVPDFKFSFSVQNSSLWSKERISCNWWLNWNLCHAYVSCLWFFSSMVLNIIFHPWNLIHTTILDNFIHKQIKNHCTRALPHCGCCHWWWFDNWLQEQYQAVGLYFIYPNFVFSTLRSNSH
jgi:hypothetical protein